jgi:hypothetical protein
LQISLMICDPFVAAAFKAAEDDGLAPALVDLDHPAPWTAVLLST